jgi:hypothetical protein
MRYSIVVELAGSFVGVAIADARAGYGFVAVDERLRDLAGSRWPNLASLRFAARDVLRRQSVPPHRSRDGSAVEGAVEGPRLSPETPA